MKIVKLQTAIFQQDIQQCNVNSVCGKFSMLLSLAHQVAEALTVRAIAALLHLASSM